MMNDEEHSAGGSRIHRYDQPIDDGDIAIGDEQNLEAISGHITRHVGPVEMVFRSTRWALQLERERAG